MLGLSQKLVCQGSCVVEECLLLGMYFFLGVGVGVEKGINRFMAREPMPITMKSFPRRVQLPHLK